MNKYRQECKACQDKSERTRSVHALTAGQPYQGDQALSRLRDLHKVVARQRHGAIRKGLGRAGCRPIPKDQRFLVKGEIQRARAWGTELARLCKAKRLQ